MKNSIIFFGTLLIPLNGYSQKSLDDVLALREEHRTELQDTNAGILNTEDLTYFTDVDYFNFNSDFQIMASFKKDKGKWFEMPTSTERLPVYRKFGVITFHLDSVEYQLNVYQNKALRRREGLEDYLFLPFRDSTSGMESYGGGRYLDLRIPSEDSLLIDFNLLYNPYCAYSHRYSCPIPPADNYLHVKIEAGEKTPLAH